MPLKTGKSKATIGSNVSEMMHKFKRAGTIGNTKPTSGRHALRIAAAAAHNKARRG